jgi:hypothetical protein
MKNPTSINTNSYLPSLFMVSAICLLGFTGCSSFEAEAGHGSHAALIRKTDPQPSEDADEDVVAANRDWYQMNH